MMIKIKRLTTLAALLAASASWAADTPSFVGHTYLFQYDGFAAQDSFISADTISFVVTEGPLKGLTGEVNYQYREIRPGAYLIYWQEKDGGTVTHLDDFQQGLSHSNYTTPKMEFYTMSGSIKQLDTQQQH